MKTLLPFLFFLASCHEDHKSTCNHNWTRWSEPAVTDNWYTGQVATQFCQCTICGEAKSRRIP